MKAKVGEELPIEGGEEERGTKVDVMALDVFDQYATDQAKEEEGAWVLWSGDLDEKGVVLEYLIARADSAKARAARERLQKPYLSQIRRGTLSSSIQERIAIDVMVEGIWLGWRLRYADGSTKPVMPYHGALLPYSPENAKKVLADHKDQRADIALVATEADVFRLEDREEAAKN